MIWTLVSLRTLGVPHDMLLRAERLPQVAERVDWLAAANAERLSGLFVAVGVPAVALASFGLAMLAGIGFGYGLEFAQAAFALLAPLAIVAMANLRLALWVHRNRARGRDLRGRLARRRLWNQAIAALAMLAMAWLAVAHGPGHFRV